MREFAIEPVLALTFRYAPHLPKVVGHLAKGFQNYSVLEFPEVRIPAAGESHGSRIGFMPRDGFRAPDGGGSGRAFDGLPGSQAAPFFRRKGERYIVDHLRPPIPEAARECRKSTEFLDFRPRMFS